MSSRSIYVIFALSIAWTLALSPFLARPASASSPYLQWVKDYMYTPLINESTTGNKGKLNVLVSIYKLLQDGVSDYDWYFYTVQVEIIPLSGYRNDWSWAWHQVWSSGTYRWLVDRSPTDTSGTSTVAVSLTAAAKPSFSISWSYSISDVVVDDRGDYSAHRAEWMHEINQGGWWYVPPAAGSTYLSKPGFTVKTTQNSWSFVDAQYKGTWGRYALGFWVWWTYVSQLRYLDAQRSGDS